MKPLRILAIETSCDETSVALLRVGAKTVEVAFHEIASQVPVHARYGGVVPEVAARLHVAEAVALTDHALGTGWAKKRAKPFDAVAVTRGPGLATALRVGVDTARLFAAISGAPLVGVNHLEGHLASAWLEPTNRKAWTFPILALLVSGGHTELVLMKDFCRYTVLGRTRDDAAGEAFDKTAKLLGLGYPGGPVISERALRGNPNAYVLPRPMLHDGSCDFSFSGLKTAVRVLWEGLSEKERTSETVINDLCASIQAAIVDVLVQKTARALAKSKAKGLTIVGGVSANRALFDAMGRMVAERAPDVRLHAPARGFHTDNAAMIGAAAAWRLWKGKTQSWRTLEVKPELDF